MAAKDLLPEQRLTDGIDQSPRDGDGVVEAACERGYGGIACGGPMTGLVDVDNSGASSSIRRAFFLAAACLGIVKHGSM